MTAVEVAPLLAVPVLSPEYQMPPGTPSASLLAFNMLVHAHIFETQSLKKEKQVIVQENRIRQMQIQEGAIRVPDTNAPLMIQIHLS